MEWITLTTYDDDAGKRLDSICKKIFASCSYHRILALIRKRYITINKKRTSFNQVIKSGDVLYIAEFLRDTISTSHIPMQDPSNPESASTHNTTSHMKELLSQSIYQNQGLFVINKYAGQTIFGANGINNTLQNFKRPSLSFSPAPCHRLDTNTSGILVCALTTEMARIMAMLQRKQCIHKIYLALLQSPTAFVSLKNTLYRDTKHKKTYIYDHELPNSHDIRMLGSSILHMQSMDAIEIHGQQAYPTLIVLGNSGGKTHQIRAQCAYYKTPLLYDYKYNTDIMEGTQSKYNYIDRDAPRKCYYLHASTMLIDTSHITHNNIPKALHAPIPSHWRKVLSRLDRDRLLGVDDFLGDFIRDWERNVYEVSPKDCSINSIALYTSLFGGVMGNNHSFT